MDPPRGDEPRRARHRAHGGRPPCGRADAPLGRQRRRLGPTARHRARRRGRRSAHPHAARGAHHGRGARRDLGARTRAGRRAAGRPRLPRAARGGGRNARVVRRDHRIDGCRRRPARGLRPGARARRPRRTLARDALARDRDRRRPRAGHRCARQDGRRRRDPQPHRDRRGVGGRGRRIVGHAPEAEPRRGGAHPLGRPARPPAGRDPAPGLGPRGRRAPRRRLARRMADAARAPAPGGRRRGARVVVARSPARRRRGRDGQRWSDRRAPRQRASAGRARAAHRRRAFRGPARRRRRPRPAPAGLPEAADLDVDALLDPAAYVGLAPRLARGTGHAGGGTAHDEGADA